MKHRIGLLADVHGNSSALKAVVEDAIREGATEYWFLGDLIMPGPGTNDVFELLDRIQVNVYVKGNWEDCFLDVLNKGIDFENASDIYISRLVQYQCENLRDSYIKQIQSLLVHQTKKINNLSISISHNLPNQNYGGDLWPTNEQENFDRLFNEDYDIAIYAHTHQQLLRYSSNGQLIINPGSIGQPFYKWDKLRNDRRAQYAILTIDDGGMAEVSLKKVSYDIEGELKNATVNNLPYINLYRELLKTGKTNTHNIELLQKLNEESDYKEEIIRYFEKNYWKK